MVPGDRASATGDVDGVAPEGGSGDSAREDDAFAFASPPPLKGLDLTIARELERDARLSILALARRLGVSRTTVSERLARLLEQGVIRGFHARLDYRRLGYPITAFVGLESAQSNLDMVEGLRRIPEVEEIHTVTGRIDILVKVRARSTEHLQHILIYKIQAIPGIGRGETMLALSSHLEWAPVGVRERPTAAEGAAADAQGSSSVAG